MNGWYYVILFFVILFTYIHIQHQWKTGEDLEIYEYDYKSPKALMETCNIKQPFVFSYDFPKPQNIGNIYDLNVEDVRDITLPHIHQRDMISLNEQSARSLLHTDTKSVFSSHRNSQYVHQNTEWKKWFQTWDSSLKPPFSIFTDYDVQYGSQKTRTITTFHHESHTFMYLPPETNTTFIRIKMTPYKSRMYLETKYDYINYEFWSKTNLFELPSNSPIKTMDILLKPGHVLFIPPYWFYSIEYQSKVNEICIIKYHTIPNIFANMKHILVYYMQQNNVHEKWWKPIEQTDFNLLPVDYNEDSDNEPDTLHYLEKPEAIEMKKQKLTEKVDDKDEVNDVVQELIHKISVKN